MFGNVSYNNGYIYLDVLKEQPENNEFDEFVAKSEKLYMTMNKPFILALNLHKMGILGPSEVIKWMAMFFRVIVITEKYLSYTIVHLNKSLKDSVTLFLNLYNPVKPFHVFYSQESFSQAINFANSNNVENKS